MRKNKISRDSEKVLPGEQNWLDLERLAQVEITSESEAHPIESALTTGTGPGWRAAEPGEQRIRINFDQPLSLRRIRLMFHEEGQPRTQEFVLRWSPDGGRSYREIVHQQYNFSPPGTTREVEDYRVGLNGATALELRIVPDVSGSDAYASLAQLRLA
jgi:hypothetical protein